MKVRIVEANKEYFVDYEIEKNVWKNESVHKNYDAALAAKRELLELLDEHETTPNCWCKPVQDPECKSVWIHNSNTGHC